MNLRSTPKILNEGCGAVFRRRVTKYKSSTKTEAMADASRPEYVQYGCGLCAPSQWTNFDASPTLRAQRVPLLGIVGRRMGAPFPENVRYGDIVMGLPVPAGTCSAVYCSHTLEHLSFDDFHRALVNTFQMLRPGGIFRLVLPDLEALARRYVEAQDADAASRFLREAYLGVVERERGIKGMLRPVLGNSAHLWMWDYKSMEKALREAGFVEIRRAPFGDSDDPMFKLVEEPERWTGHLGVQCRRTS